MYIILIVFLLINKNMTIVFYHFRAQAMYKLKACIWVKNTIKLKSFQRSCSLWIKTEKTGNYTMIILFS